MNVNCNLCHSFVLTGKCAGMLGVGGLISLLVIYRLVTKLLLSIEGSRTEGADVVGIVTIDDVVGASKQEATEECNC